VASDSLLRKRTESDATLKGSGRLRCPSASLRVPSFSSSSCHSLTPSQGTLRRMSRSFLGRCSRMPSRRSLASTLPRTLLHPISKPMPSTMPTFLMVRRFLSRLSNNPLSNRVLSS
ncbi:hypothetical protein BGZ94_000379, partial [Podila epigama]